jgi:hypothetical protein
LKDVHQRWVYDLLYLSWRREKASSPATPSYTPRPKARTPSSDGQITTLEAAKPKQNAQFAQGIRIYRFKLQYNICYLREEIELVLAKALAEEVKDAVEEIEKEAERK